MHLLAFLNKLRGRPSKTRQSPYIPDRILDSAPSDSTAGVYINHAADFSVDCAASAKKMRASTPVSPASIGLAKEQTPAVSSGRRLLSSTMNQNESTLMRKSTRKSTRRSVDFRRPFGRSRRADAVTVEDSVIVDTDLSLLPSLLNESSVDKASTVTLHGSITTKVLASLTNSVSKLNKLIFDEAIIISGPASFSSLISSLGVESLSFLGCKFDDAQLLCDQFFVENRQITELTVSTKDGSMQSFPLLTDRTLLRWASLGRQPPCLQLYNVATSFTIAGVEKLIKAFLTTASPYDRFCCKLGRLTTPMDTVVARIGRIPTLKIHCVHDSFLVVLCHNPRIDLNLQTPLRLPSPPLDGDDTMDELPALRRAPALRRRVAQFIGVMPKVAPSAMSTTICSSSKRAHESVMISKPGALSRTRRTTLVRSKRRSMRREKVKNISMSTVKTLSTIAVL